MKSLYHLTTLHGCGLVESCIGISWDAVANTGTSGERPLKAKTIYVGKFVKKLSEIAATKSQ